MSTLNWMPTRPYIHRHGCMVWRSTATKRREEKNKNWTNEQNDDDSLYLVAVYYTSRTHVLVHCTLYTRDTSEVTIVYAKPFIGMKVKLNANHPSANVPAQANYTAKTVIIVDRDANMYACMFRVSSVCMSVCMYGMCLLLWFPHIKIIMFTELVCSTFLLLPFLLMYCSAQLLW